jgi:hypothetical protein
MNRLDFEAENFEIASRDQYNGWLYYTLGCGYQSFLNSCVCMCNDRTDRWIGPREGVGRRFDNLYALM